MSTANWNSNIRKFCVILTLLFPAFCFACEVKIISSLEKIGFFGCINSDAVKIMAKELDKKPRDIVIQSEGGDVEAALKLAAIIQELKLSLLVRGYCNSSCANYLIPAAKHVYVENDSLIMFHGDVRLTLETFSDRDYIDPKLLRILDKLAQEELIFQSRNKKILLLHNYQRIASLKGEIHLQVDGVKYLCAGMELNPWVPSLKLLSALGVIDAGVPRDLMVFPEIEPKSAEMRINVSVSEQDPFDRCKKTAAD